MCMILWDVVSSRALLRLRKKLPFEKHLEAPLHNEQAAQWFQAHATAVSCHQVARHAPNHPASVRTAHPSQWFLMRTVTLSFTKFVSPDMDCEGQALGSCTPSLTAPLQATELAS